MMTWTEYRRKWRNAAREDSCGAVGWVCWHIIAAALVTALIMQAVTG